MHVCWVEGDSRGGVGGGGGGGGAGEGEHEEEEVAVEGRKASIRQLYILMFTEYVNIFV